MRRRCDSCVDYAPETFCGREGGNATIKVRSMDGGDQCASDGCLQHALRQLCCAEREGRAVGAGALGQEARGWEEKDGGKEG